MDAVLFTDALSRGVYPEAASRLDRVLEDCLGKQPMPSGLVAQTALMAWPFLVDWPFPQAIRGNTHVLLIDETSIHIQIDSGDLVPLPVYDMDGVLTSVESGGIWHCADFYDTVYLFNGACTIFPYSGKWRCVSSPLIQTGCAHKEGRLFLGGFDSDTINTVVDWETALENYVVPGDTGGVIQALAQFRGLDTNWAFWGSVGGGDILAFFDPTFMITGNRPDVYSATKPYFLDLLWKRQMGARPMPWKGTILRQLGLGEHVAVYGDTGTAALLVQQEGKVGMRAIPGFSSQIGIAGRGAVNGDEDDHVLIDAFGTMWAISGNLQAQRIGFKNQFSDMLANDIVVSMNPTEKEFWVSDGQQTWMLNRNGLSRAHQHPTSIIVTNAVTGVCAGRTGTGTTGTVWYVDADTTGTLDGLSWDTAFNTIQDAVDAADPGDQVWVRHCTLTEAVSIDKNLSIYGGFSGPERCPEERWNQKTQIEPASDLGVPVFLCEDCTVRIDGFIITCDNSASYSGIYLDTCDNSVIANCLVSGANTAGIYVLDSAGVTVENCILVDNEGSSLASVELVNTSGTVQNCVFYDNEVAFYRGHITQTVSMKNCILWGNTHQIYGTSSDLTVSYCCVQGGFTGTGNILTDPLFVNAAAWNFRCFAGSPCINTGTTGALVDFEWHNRATADMGAYEYVAPNTHSVETNWFSADHRGAIWELSSIHLVGADVDDWSIIVKFLRKHGDTEQTSETFVPDKRGMVYTHVSGVAFQIVLTTTNDDATLDGLMATMAVDGKRDMTQWLTT